MKVFVQTLLYTCSSNLSQYPLVPILTDESEKRFGMCSFHVYHKPHYFSLFLNYSLEPLYTLHTPLADKHSVLALWERKQRGKNFNMKTQNEKSPK